MNRIPNSRWEVIDEFPDWEINIDGAIRNRHTKEYRSIYEDQNHQEVTKFTKDGRRYLRSVEKLRRIAFTKLR